MLGDRKKNYPPFPFVTKSAGARLKEEYRFPNRFLFLLSNTWGSKPERSRQTRVSTGKVFRSVAGLWQVSGGYLFEVKKSRRCRQATFSKSPQIRKFLGSFHYRNFAHFLIVPFNKLQIRTFLWLIRQLQIIAKFCLKNSAKIHLLRWFFYFVQIWIGVLYTFYVKICICGFKEVLSLQITKMIGSSKSKSAKCHICGRSANLTNYWRPPTFEKQ